MDICVPGSNVFPIKRGVMGEDRRSNRNRANGNRNRHGARDNRRSGASRRPQSASQRSTRYNAQVGDARHKSQEPAHAHARDNSRARAHHSNMRSDVRRVPQTGAHHDRQGYAARSGANGRMSAQGHAASQQRSRAQAMGATAEYAPTNYVGRKRGMSRGKKVAIGIIVALVVVLACVGVAAGLWYNNIANNIRGNQDITNLSAPAADEPYYVLLMGSDAREGWEPVDDYNAGERSDSIMVARVDEKAQQVDIISVPRDLRVKVNGHGYCKINSVIEYGGYNLLVSTLNSIFDIKINYYAIVYFQGFLDLVDTLGGVTVEVPEGTADYNMDESEPDIILPAGDAVRLNGEQALVLARCRHGWPIDQGAYAMGDYQRTLNQRNLIKAIAKEVLAQDITKMPGLIESLSKCVETNMSVDRLISLAMNMKGMDVESMESSQLPIGASTIGGDWQAIMYQDVFAVMDQNFKDGKPLFENLDNFNPEFNDDNVNGNYTDGPVYAYTSYSSLHGSPYTEGYTPPASVKSKIPDSSSSGSKSSASSSSSSRKSSND